MRTDVPDDIDGFAWSNRATPVPSDGGEAGFIMYRAATSGANSEVERWHS
jgi:hypothetical protein